MATGIAPPKAGELIAIPLVSAQTDTAQPISAGTYRHEVALPAGAELLVIGASLYCDALTATVLTVGTTADTNGLIESVAPGVAAAFHAVDGDLDTDNEGTAPVTGNLVCIVTATTTIESLNVTVYGWLRTKPTLFPESWTEGQ